MSETHGSVENHHEPGLYEIRIKGHLDDRWTDWFGLTITREENGDTVLTGPVIDQAALHGLLKKLNRWTLPLLAQEAAFSDFLATLPLLHVLFAL